MTMTKTMTKSMAKTMGKTLTKTPYRLSDGSQVVIRCELVRN